MSDNSLYCFLHKQDSTPCGVIPLEEASMRNVNPRNRCFVIISRRKDKLRWIKVNEDGEVKKVDANWLQFRCKTKIEFDKWTAVLKFIKHS